MSQLRHAACGGVGRRDWHRRTAAGRLWRMGTGAAKEGGSICGDEALRQATLRNKKMWRGQGGGYAGEMRNERACGRVVEAERIFQIYIVVLKV